MTPLQLKVIYNACLIRLQRKENINDILDSYTKLSPKEREILYSELMEDEDD